MNRTRRGVLAALGAGALAPRAAFGARTYVIGYLSGGAPKPEELMPELARLGYVEGRNLRIEARIADLRDPGKLRRQADELVRSGVDLLIAWQSDRVETLAAATSTIPIVSGMTGDPVGQGLAQSLRRPGKNVTGMSASWIAAHSGSNSGRL